MQSVLIYFLVAPDVLCKLRGTLAAVTRRSLALAAFAARGCIHSRRLEILSPAALDLTIAIDDPLAALRIIEGCLATRAGASSACPVRVRWFLVFLLRVPEGWPRNAVESPGAASTAPRARAAQVLERGNEKLRALDSILGGRVSSRDDLDHLFFARIY